MANRSIVSKIDACIAFVEETIGKYLIINDLNLNLESTIY